MVNQAIKGGGGTQPQPGKPGLQPGSAAPAGVAPAAGSGKAGSRVVAPTKVAAAPAKQIGDVVKGDCQKCNSTRRIQYKDSRGLVSYHVCQDCQPGKITL